MKSMKRVVISFSVLTVCSWLGLANPAVGQDVDVSVVNAPPGSVLTMLLQAGNNSKNAAGTTDSSGETTVGVDFSDLDLNTLLQIYVLACVEEELQRIELVAPGGEVSRDCNERITTDAAGVDDEGCDCREAGAFLYDANAQNIVIDWSSAMVSSGGGGINPLVWVGVAAAGAGGAFAAVSGGNDSTNSSGTGNPGTGGGGTGGGTDPPAPQNQAPNAAFDTSPTGFGMVDVTSWGFDAGSSSDPDDDALTYEWDFGDGDSGTGLTVNHVYSSSGMFNVSVTADDGTDSDTADGSVDVRRNLAGTYTGPWGADMGSFAIDPVDQSDAMGDAFQVTIRFRQFGGPTTLAGTLTGTFGSQSGAGVRQGLVAGPWTLEASGTASGSGLSFDFTFDGTVNGDVDTITGLLRMSSPGFNFEENVTFRR